MLDEPLCDTHGVFPGMCSFVEKNLYALARQIQKHARLFAVLESQDNGKAIRETRDIDIPLVIRHFYYHAGWASERDSATLRLSPMWIYRSRTAPFTR